MAVLLDLHPVRPSGALVAERSADRGDRQTARSLRRVALVALSAFAGFVAGLDIVFLAMLESLMRGVQDDRVSVGGIGSAAWSSHGGFVVAVAPGAVVVVLVAAAAAGALGWAVLHRRGLTAAQRCRTSTGA